MREYIIITVVFAMLLFATPFVYGGLYEGEGNADVGAIVGNNSAGNSAQSEKISLFLTETDETLTLSIEEYLVGCLLAQISVNYHEEALKAQAIAAHTYLERLILDGTAISDDPTACQPFFSEEKARQHYGEKYESALEKVRAAAEYGSKRVITYEKAPIYAVYHSISAGVTNTAYAVWGQDFPYLQSVESSWDREHPDYLCINEIIADTIRLAMYDYNKTASMPVDYSRWFVNPVKNEYGYVISVKAGESILSGGDMWRIFNMRSTSFEISFGSSEVFSIETRGFGHGVGLSQYGADVLGRRGFSCEEILQHYYTDVMIDTI